MLLEFSVENFQCLKEKVTLDMKSINLSEYKETLINEKILPLAAIYGPNGGGKSTLLKALFTFQSLITSHYKILGGISFSDPFKMDIRPFKFDVECKNRPTNFEILLNLKGIEYKYFISLLHGEIIEETLYEKAGSQSRRRLVFKRNTQGIKCNTNLKIKVPNISNSMPFLVWIELFYNIDSVKNIIHWFKSVYCIDYNVPLQDELLLSNIFDLEVKDDVRNRHIKQKTLELLNQMDLNIVSYNALKSQVGPTKYMFQINTEHKVGKKKFNLLLQEESNGTKKIFSLLPLFIVALEEARTIVIDELDAKLHPVLLKYIINLFKNKETNPNGAQLIFTSHDLTTMSKDVFRRDEIWFMAMNDEQFSKLYSLVELRTEDGEMVRNDASYSKQYLEGRYGADPYLKKINNWEV